MNYSQKPMHMGYGLLRDPILVATMLDRNLNPWEEVYDIPGFQLTIVPGEKLPQNVQDVVKVGAYGLIEGSGTVSFLSLDLSKPEQRAINELNFSGAIFNPKEINLGSKKKGIVYLLKDPFLGEPVGNGLTYEHFLNGEAQTYARALALRDKYIRNLQREGSLPLTARK